MKLEAGKYYRTRDGRKAFVAAVREDSGCGKYPCVGWVIDDDQGARCWASCGAYFIGQHPLDLISEWREPVSKTVTLFLHRDGLITVDKLFSDHAIARKTVTITEGDGMA